MSEKEERIEERIDFWTRYRDVMRALADLNVELAKVREALSELNVPKKQCENVFHLMMGLGNAVCNVENAVNVLPNVRNKTLVISRPK